MRTTVDIPNVIYRQLKSKAAAEGGSVKQLLLQGAENILRTHEAKPAPRLAGPQLEGGPGTLYLTNEMIDDLLHTS